MKLRRSMIITTSVLMGAATLAFAGCGGNDSTDSTASGAEFDRAFIDAMVPHHESAIAMARAAKDAGLSEPELVNVADDILATQQDEIDQMKQWRAAWFGSSTIDPSGTAALGLSESEMGMQHDAEDMMNSSNADTDFAQLMITHHQGAIAMAELARKQAEHGELKELADRIIAAQKREIDVMGPHAGGMSHG